MAENVPWPAPPREPGSWVGGPPVGPGGAVRGGASSPVAVPSALSAAPPTWGPSGPPLTGPPVEGPEGSGLKLYDRAPPAVLVASILILAVLAGGIAYLLLSVNDRYPDKWDARVESLVDWVAAERGLEFQHPVNVNFLSESEYTAASTTDVTAEEDVEEMDGLTAEMRALGLVSGDVDLGSSMNTLSDSGTLAFYSPVSEEVFVRGQTLTPALRVTLVHELVHVLQDQHFDLSRMSELSSTRGGVLRAIAEGDAGRIEAVYVDEVLTSTEREDYQAESDDPDDDVVETIREEVPDALTALFSAPYVFGEPLVDYLLDVEGSAAIDEALRNPPSEEVLFNPHLWNSPLAEEIPVEVASPSGATEIREDEFGPIAWYLVLSSRIDPKVAMSAVDGFGGDAFVSYRDQQKVCVRMTVTGDGPAETDALASALGMWVQAGPPDTAAVVRDDDDNLQFQACDPGTETESTGSLELEVLALPVTRTMLFMEVSGSGASEGQSWCVAAGMTDALTMADLTNPDIAEDYVVGVMTGVMQTCVAEG